LDETLAMISASGGKAIAVAADVTNRAALDEAVSKTEAGLGALGIAVNAAGIANANPAEEMAEEQYQTLMDINMKGCSFPVKPRQRPCLKMAKVQLSTSRLCPV